MINLRKDTELKIYISAHSTYGMGKATTRSCFQKLVIHGHWTANTLVYNVVAHKCFSVQCRFTPLPYLEAIKTKQFLRHYLRAAIKWNKLNKWNVITSEFLILLITLQSIAILLKNPGFLFSEVLSKCFKLNHHPSLLNYPLTHPTSK